MNTRGAHIFWRVAAALLIANVVTFMLAFVVAFGVTYVRERGDCEGSFTRTRLQRICDPRLSATTASGPYLFDLATVPKAFIMASSPVWPGGILGALYGSGAVYVIYR